ncbi:hypothetical protein [Microscilla marina]|uniref:Lipoprotein n=1 Tax=Microscilla marina ATCC 23134 TaxID=313606 RepID=A1ZUT4_MICM2|nr:hypothetical protein [Microscilla marina]EAY25838.1 hypothetical protein M23134_07650 [Microscilla marina ATCC 23134]
MKKYYLILCMCCLSDLVSAQPDPYTHCDLSFTYQYQGKNKEILFPEFSKVQQSDGVVVMASKDKRGRFGLVVQLPDKNHTYSVEGYRAYSYTTTKGSLEVEWGDEKSVTADLFLFPIPSAHRKKKVVKVSSHYVMHLQMKMQEVNKQGFARLHYNFLIPYQVGAYGINLFDLESDMDSEKKNVTKFWKTGVHPTKIYTFKLR